jgi:hypothetical protein
MRDWTMRATFYRPIRREHESSVWDAGATFGSPPLGLSSFVVFGALFGLPANAALAISFSRRMRELAVGVPGLLVWQRLETHQLLRQPQ